MRIVSLCGDKSTELRLNELIKMGWLGTNTELNFCDIQVSKLMKPLGGIEIGKIKEEFQSEDKWAIITDERIETGEAVFIDEGLLVVSTSNLIAEQSIYVQIALHIFLWQNIIYRICQNECLFNENSANLNSLCSSCEDKLINSGELKSLLKCKTLIKMMSLKPSNADISLNKSLSQNLTALNLSFKSSILNCFATRLILDDKFHSGSEVRKWVEKNAGEIYQNIDKIHERYESTINKSSNLPFFIASRRWNSWTPNQPRKQRGAIINIHQKNGGGYFLSDGKMNMVIDPGYGFLDMIYHFHRLTVMDIDSIIITHDHPDHSSDLQNILSLRYVYKDKCDSKLNLYLNPSAYYLYQRMIAYYSNLINSGKPHVLHANTSCSIGGFDIKTIDTFHREIYDNQCDEIKDEVKSIAGASSSIGLKINGVDAEGLPYTIALPGDTSFPVMDDQIERIGNFFLDSDIVSLHIGSLEKQWITDNAAMGSEIEYGEYKHLGLNGAIKFLNTIRPRIIIISEFGEELHANDYRLSLIEIIRDSLTFKYENIFPSDFPLYIVINRKEAFFKCTDCGLFVPISNLNLFKDKNEFLMYHFKAGCKSKLNHFTESEIVNGVNKF